MFGRNNRCEPRLTESTQGDNIVQSEFISRFEAGVRLVVDALSAEAETDDECFPNAVYQVQQMTGAHHETCITEMGTMKREICLLQWTYARRSR